MSARDIDISINDEELSKILTEIEVKPNVERICLGAEKRSLKQLSYLSLEYDRYIQQSISLANANNQIAAPLKLSSLTSHLV